MAVGARTAPIRPPAASQRLAPAPGAGQATWHVPALSGSGRQHLAFVASSTP
jgi:hypothetical protein